MVGYEDAQPYQKYKKKKNTMGNLIGGFTTILVGMDLLKQYKNILK